MDLLCDIIIQTSLDRLFNAVKDDCNNSRLVPALTRLLASWHHLPTELTIESDTANAILELSKSSMKEHFYDPVEFGMTLDCCTMVRLFH